LCNYFAYASMAVLYGVCIGFLCMGVWYRAHMFSHHVLKCANVLSITCVYACVYVCMNDKCICVYKSNYIPLCMNDKCMRVYISIYIPYTHTYFHTNMHICIHAYILTNLPMHACVCMNV
jgi:hypothetical protein